MSFVTSCRNRLYSLNNKRIKNINKKEWIIQFILLLLNIAEYTIKRGKEIETKKSIITTIIEKTLGKEDKEMGKKLKFREKLCYGIGDFGSNMTATFVGGFILL